MPTINDGIMVILSSPSGAGKTTLVNLLSKDKKFEISISHTTRQPRNNEIPDKDYLLLCKEIRICCIIEGIIFEFSRIKSRLTKNL